MFCRSLLSQGLSLAPRPTPECCCNICWSNIGLGAFFYIRLMAPHFEHGQGNGKGGLAVNFEDLSYLWLHLLHPSKTQSLHSLQEYQSALWPLFLHFPLRAAFAHRRRLTVRRPCFALWTLCRGLRCRQEECLHGSILLSVRASAGLMFARRAA